MPQDLPHEVVQRLIEAANNLRSVWDELRPFVPAIRVENQQFGDEDDQGALLEIVHIDLENRDLKGTYQIAPGEHQVLMQPKLVGKNAEKVDQPDSIQIPPPDTILPGSYRPPSKFGSSHQVRGEIIQVKILEDSEPGARAYVRVDDLGGEPLRALLTVPDGFPIDLVDPRIFSEQSVGPHGQYRARLTQPLSDADKEQVILFYSFIPWNFALSTIVRPNIG